MELNSKRATASLDEHTSEGWVPLDRHTASEISNIIDDVTQDLRRKTEESYKNAVSSARNRVKHILYPNLNKQEYISDITVKDLLEKYTNQD